MITTFADLGLGDLPLEEKRIMANELMQEVESADIPGDQNGREAMFAEFDRRLEEADTDPSQWLNWDDVYAATKKRLAERKLVAE